MNKKTSIQKAIQQLPQECFEGAMIGLEKESLRIRRDGFISHAPHPEILGSSLTHPCITTDFSESLLELVTPPCTNSREVLDFLADTETFVHRQLPDEFLWAASMPCLLRGEDDIPIAHYGDSRLGKMKTIYRRGLAHRYGKIMQVIAGTHFNYSFSSSLWSELHHAEKDKRPMSTFINQKYMATIRNMQRYGWLNLYLFGASPAICQSFMKNNPDSLERFDQDTYYHPHATSLRMSEIGYTNSRTHSDIQVSYDSLEDYIQTLGAIINTPYPAYGIISRLSNHEPQQLNSNILQIENEYYTTVRPKQIPQNDDESHFSALKKRGIRYVELRSLDINPFCATGLEQSQLHFLEMFMHYCLLKDSPVIGSQETGTISRNLSRVALKGRKPQLQLCRDGNNIEMQQWALEILDEMQSVATSLDNAHDSLRFNRALTLHREMVLESQLTPSARILSEMREHNESYTQFVKRKSIEHHDFYQAKKLSEGRYKYYETLSRKSHRQQRIMETGDRTKEMIDRLPVKGSSA